MSTEAGRRLDTPYQLAVAVRDAVLAVDGVTRLHAGAFGEVATYGTEGRVAGVRVRADRTTVHLVVAEGSRIGSTAAAVRAVVAELTTNPIDIVVADLAAPDADLAAPDADLTAPDADLTAPNDGPAEPSHAISLHHPAGDQPVPRT